MAEFWASAGGAALIGGGASILGGILGGKSKKKQAKAEAAFKAKEDRALMADEAKYGAISSLFQQQLQDYQSQLQRQRKERGLDQFRYFNTMKQIDPNYQDTSRIVVPQAPSVVDYNAMALQAGMSAPNKL